jgi:uncharacterized cupin superfamily protein
MRVLMSKRPTATANRGECGSIHGAARVSLPSSDTLSLGLTQQVAPRHVLEGESRTSGKLLHKGSEGRSECGIWRCTPGKWVCQVTRDEFCHFLAGRCTYVHDSGEVIEITPDTAVFFPENWKGVCTVHETVTKVYMIR